jgi:hypothetical protein
MKNLVLKLIFPLAIISMVLFTKYWHVIIVDGPDMVMYGFPLPYISPGANSMTQNFFVLEFIVDFLTYFLSWLVLFFLFYRYVHPFKIHMAISIPLWCIAGAFVIGSIWLISLPEISIKIKRDYDIHQTLETGYKFIWE